MAKVIYGDFEWESQEAKQNELKHGVTFEEAATVFHDPFAIDAPDMEDPMRVILIGMSETLRVLFVVACESTGSRIRLISARRANVQQRRLYEKRT